MKEILLIAEYGQNELTDLSKETLGVAGEFADACGLSLAAVAFGNGYDQLAGDLASFGAARVYRGEAPAHYNGEVLLPALENLIRQIQPELIVGSMSVNGRELMARLACRLQVPFVPGCTGIGKNPSGETVVVRGFYGGRGQAAVILKQPGMAILGFAPGSRGIGAAKTAASPPTETIEMIQPGNVKVEHLDLFLADPDEIDLGEADLVIAGGNGMADEAGFQLLRQVAADLQAAVGGSRLAVDKGWIPAERMVGATGKVIRSDVYIACGISGAVQHMMGIRDCRTVIAVNKNPRAEIMQAADLAVIGNVREILPALIHELRDYRPKMEAGRSEDEKEQ